MKTIFTALLFLATVASMCGVSYGSSLVPSKLMEYFVGYEGKWTVVDDKQLTDGKPLTKSTSCRFSHGFDLFTIYQGYRSGQISFSDSVSISSQQGRICHAVLYQSGESGHESLYFKGVPDRSSKIMVMEALFSKRKQPKYLIIDFTPCPKNPPVFMTSNEKPSG